MGVFDGGEAEEDGGYDVFFVKPGLAGAGFGSEGEAWDLSVLGGSFFGAEAHAVDEGVVIAVGDADGSTFWMAAGVRGVVD